MINLLYELRDKYRDLLLQYDKVVQGNPDRLVDNITPFIEETEGNIKLIFSMPKEWEAIEDGQPPHYPNHYDISKWIEQKPVIPYESPDGRIPTTEQLTFLICRKIAREGTDAYHLLEQSIVETDFINRAVELIKEEYKKKQVTILNEIFK